MHGCMFIMHPSMTISWPDNSQKQFHFYWTEKVDSSYIFGKKIVVWLSFHFCPCVRNIAYIIWFILILRSTIIAHREKVTYYMLLIIYLRQWFTNTKNELMQWIMTLAFMVMPTYVLLMHNEAREQEFQPKLHLI